MSPVTACWRELGPPHRRQPTWVLYGPTGDILGEARHRRDRWVPYDRAGRQLGAGPLSAGAARAMVAAGAGLDPTAVEVFASDTADLSGLDAAGDTLDLDDVPA